MTTPFDNMSPEKAQFIKQIVSDAAGKNQNELLPFLLNINRQIAGKHMSFSDEETDALVSQLTKNLSVEEIKASGFDKYYVDHTLGIWPQAAGGIPFNACVFQVKGDPITDLTEDLAAEQKARSTYDNILRVVKNIPEVADPIRFLRAREVVHFQRFGEALRSVQEQLDAKNFYAFNPSFDAPCKASCEE